MIGFWPGFVTGVAFLVVLILLFAKVSWEE